MESDPRQTTSNYPKFPDGNFHPVYLAQVKAEWFIARDQLKRAAAAGREAQRVWDEAVSRELETHRHMRRVLEEAGMPLPEECIP